MKRSTKRFFIVLGILTLILFAWILCQSNLFCSNHDAKDIIVSRETTYVTDAPRNPDGTVNYAAWLDTHLAEGVTKENNAAIPFLRALGPGVIGEKYCSSILNKLGLSDLPEEGQYLIKFDDFLEKESISLAENSRDQLDHAMEKPWTKKDFPDIAKWLQVNETPLSLIEEGSKRTHFYVPIPLEQDNFSFIGHMTPGLTEYRSAGKAYAARAMLKLGNGDIQSAWDDTMIARRPGK